MFEHARNIKLEDRCLRLAGVWKSDNWIFSEFDCNEKLNRIKLII